MKKVIQSENAPKAIGPYSQGIQTGSLLFISGQLPVDPISGNMSEDIQIQTKQSLENVKAVVLAAGFSMDDIMKTTVYVKDLGQFSEINQVYANYFSHNPPARACVEIARLPKDAGVEIEAIACKGRN
ncbi:MAG: RidA family protein [Bacillota bacterium]